MIGITRKEQEVARRSGIPEGVVQRMIRSERLSIDEQEFLHEKGYVYVPGYSKNRGSIQVRAFLRGYRGLTPKRERALVKARSVWAGKDQPSLRVPGYEPMSSAERKKAMPGGNI